MNIENWISKKKQEVAARLGLKVDDISIHLWQGFDWKGSDKSRPRGSWYFLEISRQAPNGQIYGIYARSKRGATKVMMATLVILLCFILLIVYVAFFQRDGSNTLPEHNLTSPIISQHVETLQVTSLQGDRA